MAAKKTPPPTSSAKKTLIKIAETVGTVVGEISVKKDQLAQAVKEKIQNLTSPKEKVAVKLALKKTAKKAVKAVKKKADTALKAASKKLNSRAGIPKVTTVVKKAAVAKKAVKKAVKKAKRTAQRRR